MRDGTLTGDERQRFAFYLALQGVPDTPNARLGEGMTSQIADSVLRQLYQRSGELQ